MILSTRLATFLHEVFGHALVAYWSGGKVWRIDISLFGGGRVRADLGTDEGVILFIYSMAGIFINLATGIISIFPARSRNTGLYSRLFWSVFAIISLSGSFAYLTLGFYYDFGDPTAWMRGKPVLFEWYWVPFAALSPFIAYWTVIHYIPLQESVLPANSSLHRLRTTMITFGISCLVYLLCFVATHQDLASVRAPQVAYNRAKTQVIENRKNALETKIRKLHPNLTEEQIRERIESIVIRVEPDEVPTRFPLVPVVAILFVTGGLAAVWKSRKPEEIQTWMPNTKTFSVTIASAFLVLALLLFTGGNIYNAVR